MSLLLDTHVLVWLDEGSPRLGSAARAAIDAAWKAGELAVSAITFWEIATLQRKGRLELELDLWQWRAEWLGMGLREISVTGELSLAAGSLEDFHGDPADRVIAVTAQRMQWRLCTADERLLAWLPEPARMIATL